jgi:hypothetical protein
LELGNISARIVFLRAIQQNNKEPEYHRKNGAETVKVFFVGQINVFNSQFCQQ